MKHEVLRHLFLGFIRLHILYHAAKEKICGAEIMEELQHHGYDVGPGTLYPMLHQMHEAGLIKNIEETIDGKRRKSVCTTASGKRLLKQARLKVKELAAEILDDQDARKIRHAKNK